MIRIPREAREGLMRAWLAILREKHPEFTWVAVERKPSEQEPSVVRAARSAGSAAKAVVSDVVAQTA